MRTIEARAIISAEDRTSGVFDKIAKKFDALAKSTKAAENVNRLTNSLRNAETQLRSIDKFNAQRGLFADARSRFRDAQVGIERSARAMAAAEKPTRALELAHRRAEAAVKSTSRAFEEQKIAVLGAKRAVESSGSPISKIASEQARLRTVVERTNRALHQQNTISNASPSAAVARRAARGGAGVGGNGTLAAVGETSALYGAGRLAKHAIKEGAEFQHERVRMEAAGMSPQEIDAAEHEAGKLSKKYLPVSQNQIMHVLRNTRSVVGSYHEAAEVADPLLALRVVAMGAHPEKSEDLNADFDKLIKGMEIKGVTQDPARFRHYIDNMAKSVNVFGDTLRPTDFYEMFKYGRGATTALSDDFMLSTAPTLAQELGGSSTGKALSSFYTQFVGGRMSNKATAQLEKYGMLDPKKVIKTSTGNVKGVLPGGILGQEYLKPGKTDPYNWVNEVLLPHLASKGVTDPAEIQEVITAMSSQATTGQMLSIFATQQSRIQKDKAMQKGALGIDAAPIYMKKDPKIGAKSIISQSNNILQSATSPAMKEVTPVLDSVSLGLANLAEAAKEHPWLSTIATGGVGAGILAGGASAAGTILPALFGTLPEGGLAGALGASAKTAGKWAMRGSGWTTAALLAWEAYKNRDELGNNALGRGEHAVVGDPWKRGYDASHPKTTLDELRRQRDERNASRPSSIEAVSKQFGSGGQVQAQLTGSAQVTGEATITVKVEAGSELLRVVEGAKTAMKLAGSLNANGAGSTGKSSPDAGANVGGP